MTPFAVLLICLGLVFVFFSVAILLTPSANSGGEPISRWTRLFLVALRLAIGWHFLSEGLDKINNPTWSSENYLRGSTGPLAEYFRGVADEDLRAKLTLGPGGEFPAALHEEWQRYRDAFVKEFEPSEERVKKHFKGDEKDLKKTLQPYQDFHKKVDIAFDQAKSDTRQWFIKKQEVTKLSPYLPRTAQMTVAERLAHYDALIAEIDTVLATQVQPFGVAAEDKLKTARDEADHVIKELKLDLAKQTAAMKEKLAQVLPKDSQRSNLPPLPRPPISEWTQLQWSDNVVPWALTIVGGLLIVGLFTRLSCLVGAGWMLMLYLTMMPLPGWPDPPRVEGHYLFINKNFIEMLALLTLATTRSGRWLGLDSLLALFFRRSEESVRSRPVQSPGAGMGQKKRPVSAS